MRIFGLWTSSFGAKQEEASSAPIISILQLALWTGKITFLNVYTSSGLSSSGLLYQYMKKKFGTKAEFSKIKRTKFKTLQHTLF